MTDSRKPAKIRVLVADDQPHILEAVELLLQPQGIHVDTARSPQLMLEALSQSDYDVLLIDLNYTRDTTSGKEGLDLLARLQEIDPRMPVIVMTAWGNIDLAVESIKRGARDFIQKPWENDRLISLIRVHAELHQALRRARQLELENRLLRAEGMPEFIAGAPNMQPVLELIAQVGPSDANVLITGEHGTGKEIVAKLLHAASPRARMALVAVNAGGLPEGTFESEIFGHVKGAFTDARTDRVGRFELAHGGAWVPHKRVGSTCVCSRPPTRSCKKKRLPAIFVKTFSSASIRWRSIYPPCATGEKISRSSRCTFCKGIVPATASKSPASLPRQCSR
jgi:DNA-binding NtrC family response regulator